MDIKRYKDAEERLIQSANENIVLIITNEIKNLKFDTESEALTAIQEIFCYLHNTIIEQFPEIDRHAFQWFLFHTISEQLKPMPYLKVENFEDNQNFYQKCKLLHKLNVTATQFGADPNYTIPLRAAVVELSVIDMFTCPFEKINCFCNTYDLLFAEIKTAMISMISASDKENDIPVVNKKDMLPILMITIINSRLLYMFSNLILIKQFYFNFNDDAQKLAIFNEFEEAVNAICQINKDELKLESTETRGLSFHEIVGLMVDEVKPAKSLAEQESQRVFDLISTSTMFDFPP